LQDYARLLKKNFPTIDGVIWQKHLFQMTVSDTHSVNLAGLNKAMIELGLIGGAADTPQPCVLYFVAPPDIFPSFKHKLGSIVPAGSTLPENVDVAVLEIPLPCNVNVSPAAGGSVACSSSSKRTLVDANNLVPPPKKAATSTSCDCTTGCASNKCKCRKAGNNCGLWCHKTQPKCQNCI
jgi:hypothetical protein